TGLALGAIAAASTPVYAYRPYYRRHYYRPYYYGYYRPYYRRYYYRPYYGYYRPWRYPYGYSPYHHRPRYHRHWRHRYWQTAHLSHHLLGRRICAAAHADRHSSLRENVERNQGSAHDVWKVCHSGRVRRHAGRAGFRAVLDRVLYRPRHNHKE